MAASDLSEYAEDSVFRDDSRYCSACEDDIADLEARDLDYTEGNFDPRMMVAVEVYDQEGGFASIGDGDVFYGYVRVYCETHNTTEFEDTGNFVRRGNAVIPDYVTRQQPLL